MFTKPNQTRPNLTITILNAPSVMISPHCNLLNVTATGAANIINNNSPLFYVVISIYNLYLAKYLLLVRPASIVLSHQKGEAKKPKEVSTVLLQNIK